MQQPWLRTQNLDWPGSDTNAFPAMQPKVLYQDSLSKSVEEKEKNKRKPKTFFLPVAPAMIN